MEESVSAIDTMHLVIERLKQMQFTGPEDPEAASVQQLNVGSMRAGLGREYHDWRSGQVPDFASIKLSIRYGPGQSEDTVLADVRRELERLHQADPRVVTELVVPAVPTRQAVQACQVRPSERIVQAVVQAYVTVRGTAPLIGAVAPYRYYGSDASHLQRAGIIGVVCGAGGKYNTMPDERVELPQIRAATRMYALAARTICS